MESASYNLKEEPSRQDTDDYNRLWKEYEEVSWPGSARVTHGLFLLLGARMAFTRMAYPVARANLGLVGKTMMAGFLARYGYLEMSAFNRKNHVCRVPEQTNIAPSETSSVVSDARGGDENKAAQTSPTEPSDRSLDKTVEPESDLDTSDPATPNPK